MAGQFARAIDAKTLAVTHFSNRYRFDSTSMGEIAVDGAKSQPSETAAGSEPTELNAVDVLVEEAKEAFGSDRVVAAQDFMMLNLPRHPFHDAAGAFPGQRDRSQVAVAAAVPGKQLV